MLPDFDALMAVDLDYLMYELNNDYDHVTNYLNNPSSFPYLVSDSEYTSAGIANLEVAHATEIVLGSFEIPGSYSDIKDGLSTSKEPILGRTRTAMNFYNQFNSGTSSTTGSCSSSSSSSTVIGDISQPSENIQCDPRTVDLGVHEGYIGGKSVQTRLCLILNITSSHPSKQDIQTPNRYNVAVSSRVSGAFYQMGADAAASGNPLRAGSSFRTYEQQVALSGGGPGNESVAAAGHSAHNAGLAIDFSQLCGEGLDKVCNEEFYPWIKQNSKNYMITQYTHEYWHFSARSFLSNGGTG